MPPRILSLLFSSLLAGATMLPAATIVRPPIPLPPVRNLGVTVSLTTSGYEFNIGEIRPLPGPPGTMTPQFIALGPLSFPASFEVINHTRKPIAFEIPQVPAANSAAIAPVLTVIFSIYDQDGALVWTSAPDATGAVPQETLLKAGGTWHLTAQIPLQVNGQWLKGDYTLVAAVNGTPTFSATAAFKVGESGAVATDDVQGQVLAGPVFPVAKPGVPNERPVAGAIVQYQNNATPAAGWQEVTADDQGRFSFNVPAGTYNVTATIPGDVGTSFGHGQKTITVDGVNVTQVTFHLDTGIRVPIHPIGPIDPIGPIGIQPISPTVPLVK